MPQSYTVYIEGRPLVITAAPPAEALPEEWVTLRVDGPQEVGRAVELLHRPGRLVGVRLFNGPDVDAWDLFASRYRFVQAAGGVVVDEHGRMLAIRRLGRWDLPKGKVEEGEGIEAAAVREVQEECGITQLELVSPIAVTWHTYTQKGKDFLKRTDWFLMSAPSTQRLAPQHEESIEEVRWFAPHDAGILKADTYASLLPVIDAWARRN